MARSTAGVRRGAPARFATPVAATAPLKAGDVATVPQDIIVPDAIKGQDAIAPVLRSPIPFVPSLAPKASSATTVDEPTVDDLDRLWDWVRSDREGTTGFLGQTHDNSRSFFQQVSGFVSQDQMGAGWFRSIRRSGELIGFVMMFITTERVGSFASYIEPQSRKDMDAIISAMVANANAAHPGLTMMAVSGSEDISVAFESCGFERKIVLTRPATTALTGANRDGH